MQRTENRGVLWLVAGFLFCPCHLPLTLWMLGTLLAGTAIGALLREHLVIAAMVISAAWVLATWRGLRLLRSARRYAARVRATGQGHA